MTDRVPPVRVYVTHHRLVRLQDERNDEDDDATTQTVTRVRGRRLVREQVQRPRRDPSTDAYMDAFPPEDDARIQFIDVPMSGYWGRIVWVCDDRHPTVHVNVAREDEP